MSDLSGRAPGGGGSGRRHTRPGLGSSGSTVVAWLAAPGDGARRLRRLQISQVVVLLVGGLITILVAMLLGSRLNHLGNESRADQRALNAMFTVRDGLRLEESAFWRRLARGDTSVPASSRMNIDAAIRAVERIAGVDRRKGSVEQSARLRAALGDVRQLLTPPGAEPPVGTAARRALQRRTEAAIGETNEAFQAWITIEEAEVARLESSEERLGNALVGWLIGAVAVLSAVALGTWILLERVRRKLAVTVEHRRTSHEALLSALQDGLVVTGPDGRLRHVNDAFCSMTRFVRDDLVGRSHPYPFWAPADLARIEAAAAKAIGGEGGEYDLTFVRADGSTFPVIASLSPLRGEDGETSGYLGTFKDITERQITAAARAREEAAAEGLRRAIEARDAERAHLARELHDDTAHGLAIMALQIDALEEFVVGDEGRTAMEELRESTHTTLAGVRAMATELRPPTLREYGLAGAIERQAARLREIAGTDIDVDLRALPDTMNDEVQVTIFRVVQEALANVARHSGARRARVRVDPPGETLRIRIWDDGRGFDPGAPTDRLGLAGMRERLALIGGRLTASSRRGDTTLVAEVPLGRAPVAEPVAKPRAVAAGARWEALRIRRR